MEIALMLGPPVSGELITLLGLPKLRPHRWMAGVQLKGALEPSTPQSSVSARPNQGHEFGARIAIVRARTAIGEVC